MVDIVGSFEAHFRKENEEQKRMMARGICSFMGDPSGGKGAHRVGDK